MAINSYTTLASAVASWLDVPSADLSVVASDLIGVAEKRVFDEVRTASMEADLSATISSGAISVPSDYLELKYAYIDGNPTQWLEIRPVSWIYERYPTRGATGKPKFIARDGSSFLFGPYPDSDYAVKGVYYKQPTSVQASASAFFLANTDAYLFACLAESEQLIGRDTRIPIWESKYKMIRDRINNADAKSRFSGQMSVKAG